MAAALALAAACGGDDTVAPQAAIITATPEMIDPSADDADDLSIVVDYRDADGDLGEGVAEVHDCRTESVTIVFDIPPIASEEAVDEGVPIEGELELIVNDIGEIELDDAAPDVCDELGVGAPRQGEVVFCVVLIDAAGNEGEGDCTPAVTIATE